MTYNQITFPYFNCRIKIDENPKKNLSVVDRNVQNLSSSNSNKLSDTRLPMISPKGAAPSFRSRVSRSNKETVEETDETTTHEVIEHGGIFADIKMHVNEKGGPVIFAYKTLRLIGCLILVGLTIATLLMDENDRQTGFLESLKKKGKKKKKHAPSSDEFTKAEWMQVALCLFYVRSFT